jgi:hypothetical protein
VAGGLFGKFQAQRNDEDPDATVPGRGALPQGGRTPSRMIAPTNPPQGMPPPGQPVPPALAMPHATPQQLAMVNPSRPGGDALQPSEMAELMAAMNARSGELQQGPMPEQASDIDLALRGGQPFAPDELAAAAQPNFAYGQMADPLKKTPDAACVSEPAARRLRRSVGLIRRAGR